MRIETNPDREFVQEVRKKLKANNGYCPCALRKDKSTKCICEDFLQQEEGMCACGLYIKYKD